MAVLQCLHLDTPLLEQPNTKKPYGAKNNCMHVQLGQIVDERYKETKKTPTATFEGPGAKPGYCACPLHTTLPKGWAKHLSHPSSPTPGHTPTLTPYKEPACPSSRSNQGNLLLVFAPLCCSLNKALPEFLVQPLINFY